MAWVSYERIVEGTSLSGKYGESMRAVERWQIRTDSPLTSKADILVGVSTTIGVTYGTAHFDLPALKAQEFELSPVGRDGMRWVLTVQYYIPTPGKEVTENGIPDDVWERSGGVTSVPAFTDRDGESIVNAAGDPLEGLEKERDEESWTLTRCYEDDTALESDIDGADGRINESTWNGRGAGFWKCYFKGAKRVTTSRLNGSEDGGTLLYIEAQWEFRYDPGSWKLMPWDVGFMELVGSGEKRTITTDDGKPVKQPVGLAVDGTALAAGTKPVVANGGEGFDIYEEQDFEVIFGTPSILPAGSS
jgi:hypothetical protein